MKIAKNFAIFKLYGDGEISHQLFLFDIVDNLFGSEDSNRQVVRLRQCLAAV